MANESDPKDPGFGKAVVQVSTELDERPAPSADKPFATYNPPPPRVSFDDSVERRKASTMLYAAIAAGALLIGAVAWYLGQS